MWGLYLVGLVAYIPAIPVQNYLSLTLHRIGYSIFDSNMLSIPSAVLQTILMLLLAYSSDFFKERTWHCMLGEFWVLPLLAALLALHPGGVNWGRFAITTMISGCKLTHFFFFFFRMSCLLIWWCVGAKHKIFNFFKKIRISIPSSPHGSVKTPST